MKFPHLHVHTTYSFLDGFGIPEQYIDRLKANGQNCIAITDHGSTWGHVPFYFRLKEAGIKVILGIEAYYDDYDATQKNAKRYHMTILAKNNAGLKNLYKLQSWAQKEGFYYKPRIDDNSLYAHKKGLIVLSGCMGDSFIIKNISESPAIVEQWMRNKKENLGKDFYVELSPIKHNRDKHKAIIEIADNLNIKIALTSDTHFPAPDHYIAEDLMLSIGTKSNYYDTNRLKLDEELYLFNNQEAIEKAEYYFGKRGKEFIQNTIEIADKCNIEFKEAKRLHYYEKDFKSEKAIAEFEKLIEQGWEYRNLNKNDPIYKERAEREKQLIIDKKFVNYFLIISDMVRWAKTTMLVGPARGSVAGSLIAYLLRITEVNPIPFDLIFERFIDVTRTDLPDIDLDFPHKRRDEVINYMRKKYGSNHVSLLGTIGYFKSKNAIWDVGRIFGMPFNASKNLAGAIIERSSGDSRASFCIADSMEEIEEAKQIVEQYPKYKLSADLEGQARQSGVHAAAVIVSANDLFEYGSFANVDGKPILCMDKHDTENLNLLKIDVLSLKQLTIIENILKQIDKSIEWLYTLPIDDWKSYETLRQNLFQGIFQFEGQALKAVSKQSDPDTFESMSEISALARPGALHCGGTTEYLDRRAYDKGIKRKTKKPTEYTHELIKKVSEETYGVIIYQEQVMRIGREIGKFSWADTVDLRRLISKSKGVEYFNRYLEKFKKGAKENGLTDDEISDIWNRIATFGSWAFNKSHSISYGYISYWTLYLKIHYTEAFYICTLQQETDESNIKYLLREWTDHFGRKFVPLHPDYSEMNFVLKDGIIYGGFQNIKGIGEKMAAKIIDARSNALDRKHFRKLVGKKAFELLESFNCIPNFDTYQQDLFQESHEFKQNSKIKINYEAAPWADLHPIGDKYKFFYDKYNFNYIKDINDDTEQVRLVGKINIINLRSMKETTVTQKLLKGGTFKDEHLDKFFNLVIEDDTGVIFLGINRYRYYKFKDDIYRAKVGGIIAIEGNKVPGFLKIQVHKLGILKTAEEIEDESETNDTKNQKTSN